MRPPRFATNVPPMLARFRGTQAPELSRRLSPRREAGRNGRRSIDPSRDKQVRAAGVPGASRRLGAFSAQIGPGEQLDVTALPAAPADDLAPLLATGLETAEPAF